MEELKISIREHPGVTVWERVSAVAFVWLMRAAFLGTALLSLWGAFYTTLALLMMIGSNRYLAFGSVYLGAFIALAGPLSMRTFGRWLQTRYLRRVLNRAAARAQQRLSAAGASTSVAIPTIEPAVPERQG